MTTGAILFWGILSAYNFAPTIGTLEYRQAMGQLPADVSGYALIAVDDCGLIGNYATIYAADGREFPALVFDCAGSDGAQYFSDGNDMGTPYKLAADVGWGFWQAHPDIVRSLVLVEVEK